MSFIKDYGGLMAIVGMIIMYFLNKAKTKAEVENIHASTDDKRFDTLKKEVELLQKTVDDRGDRIEQMEKRHAKETAELYSELVREQKSCSEQMTDLHQAWEFKFNAQNKRLQELEQQLKK